MCACSVHGIVAIHWRDSKHAHSITMQVTGRGTYHTQNTWIHAIVYVLSTLPRIWKTDIALRMCVLQLAYQIKTFVLDMSCTLR